MQSYVVIFNNGTIKVGKSANPPVRVKRHRSDARKFGVDIRSFIVFGPEFDGELVESALIEWCNSVGTPLAGKNEYFSDIELGSLFAFAARVHHSPILKASHTPIRPVPTELAVMPVDPVPDRVLMPIDLSKQPSLDEVIASLLLVDQPTRVGQLVFTLNVSRATVYRAVQRLAKSGRVVNQGTSGWLLVSG